MFRKKFSMTSTAVKIPLFYDTQSYDTLNFMNFRKFSALKNNIRFSRPIIERSKCLLFMKKWTMRRFMWNPFLKFCGLFPICGSELCTLSALKLFLPTRDEQVMRMHNEVAKNTLVLQRILWVYASDQYPI